MDEIVNPYIAGAPVTEKRMFFGRDDIFQWIENSITGRYTDHILVVHGQRRVGKTSVLKQLGNRLPKRYIPVFFDLQGRTHTTLAHFLWWLARETVRVLKQDRGLEISPPEKQAFSSDPELFETQFLAGLQHKLGDDILLLTFDEFDNLEESEVREELAQPLIDHLRRLMGQPNLNFIFSIGSSGRKLENMQAAYTDFFKTALYKKISFLNEEQTHRLITRPVEGVIEYERAAVDLIYRVTSGQPYFTQLTCHELFARCQRTEQRRIAEDDVEAILDDVVERGTVNLKFVWDEATDIEKWSLAALAGADKADHRTLADILRRNRVRFSESDLISGLLHLREKDVLTGQNRFVIHLMRLWLLKNRPLEQVREELTEVNPIANRYIEIGLEFKDSRLYDKAIASFQEALAISKDNLQAQVSIALTYMDQKLYDKAIVEFEQALTMDDEDVSARAGLCEAHLALGDAAMTRGRPKDAVLSYQRVLSINAEHTEARGRMAEIARQRAEKALLNGRDEEALSAFTEALRFTPEDPSLIARVEEVRTEKKTKILAILLASSEKEALAKNWDGAVKSLEEALSLSPADETIPLKLADARAAQAKEGALAAVYADAQKAYTEKNYDQAVGLFKKIILEDENYRDASRLLMQAIELRRTAPKWWQKLPVKKAAPQPRPRRVVKPVSRRVWMIGGLLAVVAVGVAAAFWFGLFAAPAAVPTQIVSTSTVAVPVAALDPEVQAALDTVQNEKPLYQTSFDDWDTDDSGRNASLVNGKLVLTSEDEIGATLGLNAYPSDRYAVEFELSILGDSSSGSLCVYEVSNNAQFGEASWMSFSAEFWPGEDFAVLSIYDSQSREQLRIATVPYDKTKSNVVRLVVLGDQITAFINGQLAYTAQDPAGSAVYAHHGFSAYNQATCEFDYFKYWDLREIDPAVKTALAAIQNEGPVYQTNFDTWDFGESHGNVDLENGKLIVTSENQQHAGADLYGLMSDRYAVQFDLRVLDISPEGHCVFETSNNFDSQTSSWRAMSAGFFVNGQTTLARYIHPDRYENFEGAIGEYDVSKSNTVTLIILGNRIAAFVDGDLIYDIFDPAGSAFYISQALSANYTAQCEYDNFKIWDLREIDPAVKTALAAISREEPLYQNSFDRWDFGNRVKNASIENGKLILVDDARVNLNNHRSDKFAIQYDLRILENVQENSNCYILTSNDDTEPWRESWRAIMPQFANSHALLGRWTKTEITDFVAVNDLYFSKASTVTLFILEDRITAFIDGRIIFDTRDPDGGVVYTQHALGAYGGNVCEYDNYKYWDLSGVDFPAATTTTAPTSSFASILASIADKTPDYEDDFSSLSSGWPTDRGADGSEIAYQDGAYLISANNVCYGPGLPTNPVFSDFVLEMDVRFINQGQGTVSILFRDNGTASYGANLSPSGWFNFHKNVNGIHIPLLETEVPESSFQAWDMPKHLTLIARQDRMAFYVNGELVIAQADTSSSQGIFNFAVCSSNPLQALIDNLKIWVITDPSP